MMSFPDSDEFYDSKFLIVRIEGVCEPRDLPFWMHNNEFGIRTTLGKTGNLNRIYRFLGVSRFIPIRVVNR